MKKLTVKSNKKVTAGEVEFDFSIIDETGASVDLSSITGHTWNNMTSTVRSEIFRFGKHTSPKMTDLLISDSETAQERADKIVARIVEVRGWVDSCKAQDMAESGTGEAEIPPSISDLEQEIETRKRDAAGRFSK